MDNLGLLEKALGNNERLIAGLSAEQMERETPCSDWNVRELVNHMVGGAHMFGAAASRKAMTGEPPADLLGSDAVAAWRAAAAANLDGWRSPGAMEGTVTLPFGEIPAQAAAGINLLEACIHGWDLARASGQSFEADPDLVEAVMAVSSHLVTDESRQGGAFGPEVPVPAEAPAIERLVGFLGRKP